MPLDTIRLAGGAVCSPSGPGVAAREVRGQAMVAWTPVAAGMP